MQDHAYHVHSPIDATAVLHKIKQRKLWHKWMQMLNNTKYIPIYLKQRLSTTLPRY